MVKIINRKLPVVREEVSREADAASRNNEPYKLEILEALRNRLLYTTWGGGGICVLDLENTSELNPKALGWKV